MSFAVVGVVVAAAAVAVVVFVEAPVEASSLEVAAGARDDDGFEATNTSH